MEFFFLSENISLCSLACLKTDCHRDLLASVSPVLKFKAITPGCCGIIYFIIFNYAYIKTCVICVCE